LLVKARGALLSLWWQCLSMHCNAMRWWKYNIHRGYCWCSEALQWFINCRTP
jgi:hypothetical protein